MIGTPEEIQIIRMRHSQIRPKESPCTEYGDMTAQDVMFEMAIPMDEILDASKRGKTLDKKRIFKFREGLRASGEEDFLRNIDNHLGQTVTEQNVRCGYHFLPGDLREDYKTLGIREWDSQTSFDDEFATRYYDPVAPEVTDIMETVK